MRIRISFKPQDFWIGLFYDGAFGFNHHAKDNIPFHNRAVYVCILPMFPIRITWYKD